MFTIEEAKKIAAAYKAQASISKGVRACNYLVARVTEELTRPSYLRRAL